MRERDIPPQPEFLIQLRRTQHAVRNRLDAELESTGLTTPQYVVLAALQRGGELSASDLAREVGMTAQTVNVLVKGLEEDGLLRRTRHPGHGRILLASLTQSGRRALKQGLALALAIQDRLLVKLTSAERATLLSWLETIEEVTLADG
jgi:DNA-binding MarR family transcriptional regulator